MFWVFFSSLFSISLVLYHAQSQNCQKKKIKKKKRTYDNISRWAKQSFNFLSAEYSFLSYILFPLGDHAYARKCCRFQQHPLKCLNIIVLSLAISCHMSGDVLLSPIDKFSQHCALTGRSIYQHQCNSVGTMTWPKFGQRCFECYLLFYLFIGWLSLIRFLCIYLFISQSSICIFIFGDTWGFCN